MSNFRIEHATLAAKPVHGQVIIDTAGRRKIYCDPEKAALVRLCGDTYTVKAELKQMGAFYDNTNNGWWIRQDKAEAARRLIRTKGLR